LANLADFQEKMRAEGWSEDDIRQVELLARKVLASLSSPGEQD
jgi:hypothetical protein